MPNTRFEDEAGVSTQVFYLDVARNKAVWATIQAREGNLTPEAGSSILDNNPWPAVSDEVENLPVHLNVAFSFNKNSDENLVAVFRLIVSLNFYEKLSYLERSYAGKRTLQAFLESFFGNYFQAARKITSASCDAYALHKPIDTSPESLKHFVNSLHDNIMNEWAKMK